MESIILRFRDLVTEEGGTIISHRELLKHHGEVWWGWWMKQYENPPKSLFKKIAETIDKNHYYKAFLFNSGTSQFYEINIVQVITAPLSNRISAPNFEKSPIYYHRGAYPAWFLLNKIEDIDLKDVDIRVLKFPTLTTDSEKRNEKKYRDLINSKLSNLESLRETDVTMWLVEI